MFLLDYVYMKLYEISKQGALKKYNAVIRLSFLKILNFFSIISLICIILKRTDPLDKISSVICGFLIMFYTYLKYTNKKITYLEEKLTAIDEEKYDDYMAAYIVLTIIFYIIIIIIYVREKRYFTEWNLIEVKIST